MGCFNMIGCVSGATIRYRDDIVVMLAVYHPQADGTYICDNATPISLPIYGKYNDYGGIEDVVEDDNVKWLEKNIGSIDDIMEAFSECQGRFTSTIGKCLHSDNEFHPEEKVRYVYENLLKMCSHFKEDTQLCLLFEHRDLYEEWQSKHSKNRIFEEGIKKCHEIDEKYKPCYKGRISKKEKEYLEVIVKAEKLMALKDSLRTFIGSNSGYSFLSLYQEIDFLIEHKEEIIKLQNFVIYMLCAGLYFYPPVFGSQDDKYEAQIDFHKSCLELLEKKKRKLDEEIAE